MSYSQMVEILKENNKGKIVFIQTGAFYVATAEDAIFLQNTLGLKCTCFKNYICKVGVPIASLRKYLQKIEEMQYGYIVYHFEKEKRELIIEADYEGRPHQEKKQNKNCLLCKGIEKYKKDDEYMEAILKLYEQK